MRLGGGGAELDAEEGVTYVDDEVPAVRVVVSVGTSVRERRLGPGVHTGEGGWGVEIGGEGGPDLVEYLPAIRAGRAGGGRAPPVETFLGVAQHLRAPLP